MKKITMYSGDPCSFCEAAKALLKTKNVEILWNGRSILLSNRWSKFKT